MRLGLTMALPALWIAGSILLPWGSIPAPARAIILFLAVLPLVNAIFDVLSYAATLSLMARGLRSQRWHVVIFWGAADLGVASCLFLALGTSLTCLVAGMNGLAGTPLFDLHGLLAGIHAHPQDYWWVYTMVFSTIVPTALHGTIALFAL